ncbi:bifunctional 4-hydroxy-2-oxoglutarate aldolase/2-dehydro-3-deoxy-phosphogluconate aldolase [Tsukamurella soli]|uniref:Bifunctional 4-hydroxy-2-oxoglutarate aldolase/2-dehydro-3-deoxy-phosphogluconate aldolase n=1 Tax=Tsukamurella soli TaxID=644556 RepID=A0ABP8JUV9_9ACTN
MTVTPSVARPAPSALLLAGRVVAVMRAGHAREYAPVIDALVAGGVASIELTLSTEGVFDLLPRLVEDFGDTAEIGVGTITATDEAETALDQGAAFLVTPTMQPEVIAAAVRRGVPVFPGGLTPTELLTGWQCGATAVKLFPASTVGPGYIGQLRGPFPALQVVPSGGVGIDDAPAWIAAGAVAVSLGGPLLRDAFSGGSPAALTERAKRVSSLVAEAADA